MAARAVVAVLGAAILAGFVAWIWSGRSDPLSAARLARDPTGTAPAEVAPAQAGDNPRSPADDPEEPSAGSEECVVFGVVRHQDGGAPVASAQIAYLGRRAEQPGDLRPVATSTSDAKGRYTIRVPFPEDYGLLEVRAPAIAPEQFALTTAPAPGIANRQDIVLRALPTERAFELRVYVRHISGTPVPGAAVAVVWEAQAGRHTVEGTTGPDGGVEFAIAGLPHGATLAATVRDGESGAWEATWYPPPGSVALEREVFVPDGRATIDVRALDNGGARLDVPVRFVLTGSSRVNWGVEAPTTRYSGEIPAGGEARVEVAAPAAYRLKLTCPSGWRVATEARFSAAPTSVPENSVVTIERRCAPAKSVRVIVRGAFGPVRGATVTLNPMGWPGAPSALTDGTGTAEFMAPLHARWLTLTVDAPGHVVPPSIVDHPDPWPLVVTLPARLLGPASIIGEIVGSEDRTETISGVIAEAWPTPHSPGAPAMMWTRPAGRVFRISGLDPTIRYDVCVTAPGRDPVWSLGVVPANPGVRVAVRLGEPTTGVCRGQLVLESPEGIVPELPVHLLPEDAAGRSVTGMAEFGRFEVRCPPGRYRVIVADTEFVGEASGCMVPGPDVLVTLRRRGPPPDRAYLMLEVVDADDATPIVGAEIALVLDGVPATDESAPPTVVSLTDESGTAAFTLFGGGGAPVVLDVRAEGYAVARSRLAPPWKPTRVVLKRR